MSIAQQEFTNVGRSMLGRAQAGETLTISSIVVGDGTASQPSDLWPLLALIDTKLVVTISAKNDLGNGTLLVEGSFESPAATAPFYLREVGVMAHVGTEPDRLYSVANVFADPPDYIDPAAPVIEAFKIKLIIDRIPSDHVIVQIGPTDAVMGQNIGSEAVGPGVFSDAVANLLEFRRLVQGTGMDIHYSPDGNSIYIGTRTLQTNLDLYVPANNPDAPPSPPPNTVFPTIQAAHDYLLQFTIPPQYQATIHVHELNHAIIQTPPINFTHPNSTQINVIGEAPVSQLIDSITPAGAPLGTTKVCHMHSAPTGLAVNKYVAILDPIWGYGGGCFITAIAGSAVTCNVYDQGGRPPYAVTDSGASSPRLVYLPTVLQLNAQPTQLTTMINCPFGIGTFKNICAIGDPRNVAPSNNLMNYLTYIWNIGGIGGALVNCWAMCARRGFNLYGVGVSLSCDHPWPYVGAIVASNCAFGIIGSSVVTGFDRTYVNGCAQGICPGQFAIGSITAGMPYTILYLNHNYYGVNCSGIMLTGSVAYSCNNTAFQSYAGGSITCGAQYPSVPDYMGGVDTNGMDLNATGLAYIWYDQWNQAMPRTTPPHDSVAPADLASGQLSFIHVQNSGPPPGGPIGPEVPQGPRPPVVDSGPGTPPGDVPWTPSPAPLPPPLLSASGPNIPLNA